MECCFCFRIHSAMCFVCRDVTNYDRARLNSRQHSRRSSTSPVSVLCRFSNCACSFWIFADFFFFVLRRKRMLFGSLFDLCGDSRQTSVNYAGTTVLCFLALPNCDCDPTPCLPSQLPSNTHPCCASYPVPQMPKAPMSCAITPLAQTWMLRARREIRWRTCTYCLISCLFFLISSYVASPSEKC